MTPKIDFLPTTDKRKPYPLSWAEQEALLAELPEHLKPMLLFKVNTGCREHEICSLRWEWEIPVPELDTSLFQIPGEEVKNTDDRLVVLNRIVKSILEEVRGQHPEFVFSYKGKPLTRMNNSAWRKARKRAHVPDVRVHDLKHTYGSRLRAAGVSFEDRQDLLGHRSGRITTHYSIAEVGNLLKATNRVCEAQEQQTPLLVKLNRRRSQTVENRIGG